MSDRFLLDGHYYQYDLGWMIRKLMEFENSVQQIIDLQTIHYADPIQWDITTQYPPNTVVVDPKNGTAYMSKKAVPSGILLSNAEYWVVIFNYQEIYNKIMAGVAYNAKDSETATKDLLVNDLVWFGGDLYRATRAIPTGTKFVPGTNITPTSIESLLSNYYGRDRNAQLMNDTVTVSGDYTVNAGDIAETSTNRTEKITKDREIDIDGTDSLHVDGVSTINRGGAVTEVNGASVDRRTVGMTTEVFNNVNRTYTGKYVETVGEREHWIKSQDTYHGKRIAIVTDDPLQYGVPTASYSKYFAGVDMIAKDGINTYRMLVENDATEELDHLLPLPYASVVSYGADPTGTDDSTTAIQNALNSGAGIVVFPKGNYIANHIKVPSNIHIVGYGASLKCTAPDVLMINNSDGTVGGYDANINITIEGLDFWSDKENVACSLLAFGHCTNVKIINCSFHDIQIWHFIEINSCNNTLIDGCRFYNYGVANKGFTEMIQLDFSDRYEVFPWFGPYDSTANNNIKIDKCYFEGTSGMINGNPNDIYAPSGIGNHNRMQGKVNNVEVSNCTFSNLGSCMKTFTLHFANIHNNFADSCMCGIYASGYYSNNIIENNIFYGRSNYKDNYEYNRGLYFLYDYLVESNYINHNVFRNFGGHGVTAQGNLITITNNIIHNNGKHGLYIAYDNFGIMCSGNTVYNNGVDTSQTFYDFFVHLVRNHTPSTYNIGDITISNNKCGKMYNASSVDADSHVQPVIIDQNFIKSALTKTSSNFFKYGSNWVNFAKS